MRVAFDAGGSEAGSTTADRVRWYHGGPYAPDDVAFPPVALR
jgi:hypothetical protein